MFVKSSILLAFVIAGALATSTAPKDCNVDEAELMMVDGSECLPLVDNGVDLTAATGAEVPDSRRRRAADDETETQTIQLTDNAVLVINRPKAPVEEVEPKEIDTPSVTPLESCTYNIEGVSLSACKPLIIHRLQTAFGNVTSIKIGEAALAKLNDEDKEIIKRETDLDIPAENEIDEDCDMVLMGVEMVCEDVAVITENDEEGEKIVTVTVAEPVAAEVADEDTTQQRRRRQSDDTVNCEEGEKLNAETNVCEEDTTQQRRRRQSDDTVNCEEGKKLNAETNVCEEDTTQQRRRRQSDDTVNCEEGKKLNTETNVCEEDTTQQRRRRAIVCTEDNQEPSEDGLSCVAKQLTKRQSGLDAELSEEDAADKADCEADPVNEWTLEFGCMLKPTTTTVMSARRKRDAEAAKEEDSKPSIIAPSTSSEDFTEDAEFKPVVIDESVASPVDNADL